MVKDLDGMVTNCNRDEIGPGSLAGQDRDSGAEERADGQTQAGGPPNLLRRGRGASCAMLMDTQTVDHLRALDGGQLLLRTMNHFLFEINMMQESLSAVLSAGDMKRLGEMAHNFAGLCDFLGARGLSAELRDIEFQAAEAGRKDWHEPFKDLSEMIDATRTIVLRLSCDIKNMD